MPESVGAVALDIIMGKNTVTGVVKSAMSECQKVISNSSASIGQKVGAVGKAMQGVGKALMPISGAAIGAGVAIGKMSTDFENAMAKVNTIADTTEVPLGDLQKQILELSDQTGISSSEIADNVYNAISAGQKTGDAVNFVSNSTKLARAGFADAGASLDILTTILNSYGMEAKDVTKVSDVLIQTQNKGKTTVGELASYMGKVIPTANAYGVNLENVATNYAIMTAKGIATAESTTYMNSMFNELGKSSTGVAKELKNLTGKSFKELMDSGMSVGDVLMILKDNCDATGTQFSDLWSSAEAGKAALVLTQEGADGFNNTLQGMQNSTGATETAFDKMETKGYTIQKTFNTLKNTAIDLGNTLMQTLGPMIEGLSQKVAAFSKWFNGLDDGTKNLIVKIGMFVAAAGPLLIIGGKIASGAGKIIGLFSGIGKGAASIIGKIGGFGKAASTATAPVKAASGATGALSKNALGLIAAGAGILLAAAGLALLAQASIALANAGWPAIAVMGGLMVALAAMAVGAAALAPALATGAVGLVAFGAGLALCGIAVLAVCGGMAILATQLPTISEYGLSAALGITALGASLTVLAGGAILAGPALVALSAGLVAAGAGALIFTAGTIAAAAGVALLAGAVTLLAGGIVLLSAGVAANALAFQADTMALTGTCTVAMVTTGAFAALSAITLVCTGSVIANTAAIGLNALGMGVLMAAILGVTGVSVLNGLQLVIHTGLMGTFAGVTTVAAVACGALGVAIGVLTGNTSAGCRNIAGTIKNVLGDAFNWLKSIPNQAITWGKDMIQGIINGIKAMIGKVGDAVKGVANKIKSFLHFSVPDEGPLTDYESWMPDFMGGMAKGIKNSQYLVTDAIDGVATTMQVSPVIAPPQLKNASSGGYETNNGTQGESNTKVIELLRQMIQLLQGDKEITVPVYLGADLLDEQTVKADKVRALRSGGRA